MDGGEDLKSFYSKVLFQDHLKFDLEICIVFFSFAKPSPPPLIGNLYISLFTLRKVKSLINSSGKLSVEAKL